MADITRSVRGRKHPRNPGAVDIVTQWTPPSYSIDFLIVGGGGGSGGGKAGVFYPAAGSGGFVIEGANVVTKGTVTNVVVGGGGAPGGDNQVGATGGTTSWNGNTANGGNGARLNGAGGIAANFAYDGGYPTGSASGGGASNVGTGGNAPSATIGGNGANGPTSSITGVATNYAGGGPGLGSGGTGTAGLGTYGRGGSSGSTGNAGVVILKIPTSDYSGIYTGTVSTSTFGAYTILTFTTNGSYTA